MTLAERFDYETWANRKWLHALEVNGLDPEWAIFRHLLGVQKIFLSRLAGEVPTGVPPIVDAGDELETLHEGWKQAIYSHRHNPVLHYHRFDGEAQSIEFDLMLEHVLNHGTYHRGEIRGLYLARGSADFPETDLLYFIREKATQSSD